MVQDELSNKPNILLVEDTLTQAMLMQHMLSKKAGYSVKLARSGKAALDELEKASYGLILSDINMPGMDGFELCKIVKAKSEWKNIPFILLATPVEKSEILKMAESGADNFILKAFDEPTFLAKLDDIVRTQQLRLNSDKLLKAVYGGEEVSLPASTESLVLADFMISSFEMYLFQLTKVVPANSDAS